MTARYLIGDVFDVLDTLEPGSVDLMVTSPPFLALRSYLPADHPDKTKELGSEATPAEFIDMLLRFTAAVDRVLAPYGSIAVELGDTYAGSGGENHLYEGSNPEAGFNGSREFGTLPTPKRGLSGWPLSKSKALIPELYRIALAYGINPLTGQESPAGKWRVRNVVTWARPNPPVGALGDKWRPATSDVVVACRSGKRFWDDLATRKAPLHGWTSRLLNGETGRLPTKGLNTDRADLGAGNFDTHASGAPLLDYWEIPLLEGEERPYGRPKPPKVSQRTTNGPKSKAADEEVQVKFDVRMESNAHGSPLLDYWVIPPGGYSGSHYAVFPPELVEPLVKAMVPRRVCLECGEPQRRITEPTGAYASIKSGVADKPGGAGHNDSTGWTGLSPRSRMDDGVPFTGAQFATVGWSDCGHTTFRNGMVLDPFAGSGTTLLVATGHGHDAVGIDLDSRNAVLALERVGPFLLEVV